MALYIKWPGKLIRARHVGGLLEQELVEQNSSYDESSSHQLVASFGDISSCSFTANGRLIVSNRNQIFTHKSDEMFEF